MFKRLLALTLLAATPLLAQKASPAPEVAITFDDLPAHGQLPAGETRLDVIRSILDTIRREHLPPIYGFVNSGRGDKGDDAVFKAWADAGQPLGSHSFTHIDLDKVTPEAWEADLLKNEPTLQQFAKNNDWHWLRYPYLHEGDTAEKHQAVAAFLKDHGYRTAEVSLDFEDYLYNAPYARCADKGRADVIDALHDSYLATADQYIDIFRSLSHREFGRDIRYVLLLHVGAFDARMFPDLIALLRERGFRFITLQQAMSDPAYANDPGIGLPGGGGFQELVAAARKLPVPANQKPYTYLEHTCTK